MRYHPVSDNRFSPAGIAAVNLKDLWHDIEWLGCQALRKKIALLSRYVCPPAVGRSLSRYLILALASWTQLADIKLP